MASHRSGYWLGHVHLRAQQGTRVRREALEDTPLAPHSADAVFLWNCFEQLENPAGALRSVHDMLARHGLLVVRTPNFAFYERYRRNRVNPLGYNNLLGFPYRAGYSPATLAGLLQRAGFRAVAGFDSTLLTLPIPYKSAQVEREEARAARYESTVARSPLELSGPWIEMVCQRVHE